MSDIGAMDPGWWHSWHFCCRMGATSLVNVGPWATAMSGVIAVTTSTARILSIGTPEGASSEWRQQAISTSTSTSTSNQYQYEQPATSNQQPTLLHLNPHKSISPAALRMPRTG